MGLVVTSAALEATEVYSSDVIQVTKCADRKMPARPASRRSRAPSRPSSWRRRDAASAPTTAPASAIRQAAMARESMPACWA